MHGTPQVAARDGSLATLSHESFRLRALMSFVSAVAAATGSADILRVMAAEARTALTASTASLSVWERDRGRMRTLVNQGDLGPEEVAEPADEVYQLADHPLADLMFRKGIGYRQAVRDTAADPRVRAILLAEQKECCLAVPVMFEGRVWGELWATRRSGLADFDDDDLEFAHLVAALVGAGIAQSEHVERVARLAYTDELTGLANRRAFEDRLDDAVASHRAHGTPVGLVVADINGLKRINDQLGHHVGDSSLMTFAEELSAGSSTLPGTLAVRLSGDEFCLLAVGASGDEVAALADDICRRGSSVLEEGVACGVASTDDLPTTDVTPARLLRAADAAQYRAKRSGLRVPVVAGRTREGDSLDLPGSGRERRRFRGRGLATAGEVLDELVRRLDDTVDHDPQRRLAEVGRVLAQTVDAAGWFVSRLPAGSTELGTVEAGIVRRNVPDEDDAYYAANDSYPLEEYPATYAALHGHAVLVDVDDPRSDPAETSLLALGGLAQMLMAGGADGDGDRWLLEVVGDALSTPMRAYTTVVRAGVALALRA